MTVRIEKSRNLRNVIHSQTETQNAMNPESAYALQKAFLEFEKGECAAVAVYWDEGGAFCTGLDLKHTAVLEGDNPLGGLDIPENDDPARGAIGASRL